MKLLFVFHLSRWPVEMVCSAPTIAGLFGDENKEKIKINYWARISLTQPLFSSPYTPPSNNYPCSLKNHHATSRDSRKTFSIVRPSIKIKKILDFASFSFLKMIFYTQLQKMPSCFFSFPPPNSCKILSGPQKAHKDIVCCRVTPAFLPSTPFCSGAIDDRTWSTRHSIALLRFSI